MSPKGFEIAGAAETDFCRAVTVRSPHRSRSVEPRGAEIFEPAAAQERTFAAATWTDPPILTAADLG